jgi:hypothetical protein
MNASLAAIVRIYANFGGLTDEALGLYETTNAKRTHKFDRLQI